MVDVSAAAALIASGGAAVASVGVAVTGVKALTSAFKHYREAMGMSVPAAMRQARKDYDGQRGGGITVEQRQMEKDYEAMWSEQESERRRVEAEAELPAYRDAFSKLERLAWAEYYAQQDAKKNRG